jgi:cytosine/adenosine deaminase-related metal-dependent hydrolase
MHHKNVRLIIRNQLKKQHPNWKRLNKKTKKEIARNVLAEVTAEYGFNQGIYASPEELLGIEQKIPTEGIIKLDEMAQFIDMVNSSRLIKYNIYNRSPIYIQDEELRFVDELFDDSIIDPAKAAFF